MHGSNDTEAGIDGVIESIRDSSMPEALLGLLEERCRDAAAARDIVYARFAAAIHVEPRHLLAQSRSIG